MERLRKIGSVAGVHSSRVGTSTLGLGFEKLDRGVFDPEKAYDSVAASGVKWVRIQSGWARTETAKGVYDFAWLDSVVDNLLRRGLEPWMCLCYGNGLYTARAAEVFGAVGCPPVESPEEMRAWLRYVTAVVKHFSNRIKWFEIWNEPDYISCWKLGVDGTAYGKFALETARAVRAADPGVRIVGGAATNQDLGWVTDVINTGAVRMFDAWSFHSYNVDERTSVYRVRAVKALCLREKPDLIFFQGETGAQSRSDGAGGLAGHAWTPRRQAKFLSRVMLAHLFEGVMCNSFFSCLDMIEALDGKVGDKASYMDFGYFGVLGAEFDENGVATGNYTPKPSYRALQILAAVFREKYTVEQLPVQPCWAPVWSGRIARNDDFFADLIMQGFSRPDGSMALACWKPAELLTTDYESTFSVEAAGVPGAPRMVDMLDGGVYEIPERMIERSANGAMVLKNLPLADYPRLLTFGNFILGEYEND